MRADVKLGLAVGVVLFAVMLVYVLTVAGGGQKKETVETVSVATDVAIPDTAERSPATPAAEMSPRDASVAGSNAATQPVTAGDASTTESFDWSGPLNHGTPPLMARTETPRVSSTPAPARPQLASAANFAGAQATPAVLDVSAPATRPATPDFSDGAASLAAAPASAVPSFSSALDAATRPAAARAHVVQPGETYWIIAQAAYGNGAYYSHIQRANPNVPPNRLRAGMSIVLPDRAEVVPQNAELAATTQPSADPQRTYRVQPGDSLHRISIKLYGKSDRVDQIHELNKQLIGANPERLKAGTLLQLPEPATRP